jgi:8-oxo-dGTP pyrophosphatase MutT (NUDIX family)
MEDEENKDDTHTNDYDTADSVSFVTEEEEYDDMVMTEYASYQAGIESPMSSRSGSGSGSGSQAKTNTNTKRISTDDDATFRAQRLWRSPTVEVKGVALEQDYDCPIHGKQNNIQTAWTKAVVEWPESCTGDTTKQEAPPPTLEDAYATTIMEQEQLKKEQEQKQAADMKSSSTSSSSSPSTSTSTIKSPLQEIIARVSSQEQKGGRQQERQLGVLREDPSEDMRALMYNYTVPALASALRDREDTLQYCATLLAEGRNDELQSILRPFEAPYVKLRRYKNKQLDLTANKGRSEGGGEGEGGGFDYVALELLRKGLARMSRQITQAHHKRAGVVLPLCNVNGVACVLFEKRSRHLRAHPDEVCLPGGMVSIGDDKSIVVTCLREMEEEIGLKQNNTTVLGILRCNWGEISRLTGVAVTPVVGFVGELGDGDGVVDGDGDGDCDGDENSTIPGDGTSDPDVPPDPETVTTKKSGMNATTTTTTTTTSARSKIHINYDEVSECFTVPIATLLDKSKWVHREDCAPIFVGGPYVIWGLTGYIVDRFVKDILGRYTVST